MRASARTPSASSSAGQDLQRHLADVAHDLKTPISSLHLALEQAADANREPDVATSSRARSTTRSTSRRSRRISAWRARFAKAGTPAATTRTVDLTETVERVVGRARFFAKRKGIALEAAVPDGAHARPVRPARGRAGPIERRRERRHPRR